MNLLTKKEKNIELYLMGTLPKKKVYLIKDRKKTKRTEK